MAITIVQSKTVTGSPDGMSLGPPDVGGDSYYDDPEDPGPPTPEGVAFIVELDDPPTPGNVLIAIGNEHPGGGALWTLNREITCGPQGITGLWYPTYVFDFDGTHKPGLLSREVQLGDGTTYEFARCRTVPADWQHMYGHLVPPDLEFGPRFGVGAIVARITVIEVSGIIPYPSVIGPNFIDENVEEAQIYPGITGEVLYLAAGDWRATSLGRDWGLFTELDSGEVIHYNGDPVTVGLPGEEEPVSQAVAYRITADGFAAVPFDDPPNPIDPRSIETYGTRMSLFAFGPTPPPPPPSGTEPPWFTFMEICPTGSSALSQPTCEVDEMVTQTPGSFSATEYQTTCSYQTANFRVWRAGKLLDVDDYILTAPTEGRFKLAEDPGSDKILVRYQAGGAVVGSLPPPTGPALYIAPTGDDTTGDGSLTNPWQTIGQFLSLPLAPGALLYCRGGDYPIVPGNYNQYVDGIAGTALDRITIMAYPGEKPIFDGGCGTSLNDRHFLALRDGSSYWVIDGLTIVNYLQASFGIITVGFDGMTTPTEHTILRHLDIEMAESPLAGSGDHDIYVQNYVDDTFIDDVYVKGPVDATGTTGAGVHIFHSPNATNTRMRRVHFDKWQKGFQMDGATATGTIEWCTFTNNTLHDMDFYDHGAFTIRNNVSDGNATNFRTEEPGYSGPETLANNYETETLNADGTLQVGSAAIGGATDGSDAGRYPF